MASTENIRCGWNRNAARNGIGRRPRGGLAAASGRRRRRRPLLPGTWPGWQLHSHISSTPPYVMQRVCARAPAERCGTRARQGMARGGQRRVPGACCLLLHSLSLSLALQCCCKLPLHSCCEDAFWYPHTHAISRSAKQVDPASESRISDGTYKLDAIFDGGQPTAAVYEETTQGLIRQVGSGLRWT